jgi:hypothetical protein
MRVSTYDGSFVVVGLAQTVLLYVTLVILVQGGVMSLEEFSVTQCSDEEFDQALKSFSLPVGVWYSIA